MPAPPFSGHSAADLAGLEDRAGLHHLDAHPGVGLLDVDIDLVGGIATPVAQGVGEQLGEHQGDVAESPGVSGVGRC